MAELMIYRSRLHVSSSNLLSSVLIHRAPKAAKEPRWRSLLEHRTTLCIVVNNGGHDHGFDALLLGQRVAFRRGPALARSRNGAVVAAHPFRGTNGRTQFHERLIPIPGPLNFQRGVRPPLYVSRGRVGLSGLPGHDPPNVSVHTGHRLTKSDARDGPSGVGPDAGQGQQFIVRRGQTAIKPPSLLESITRWLSA